tara:strand:- start:281 stop:427 length:147 start_codon:yes stop_codon:yes gene_type:complete
MKKAKSYSNHIAGPAKRTSIGNSPLSRPKNKHKKRSHKKYRGQGKRCN